MESFEIFQKHYFEELQRKQFLTNSLAIPIGLVTVLGSMLWFFIKEFQYNTNVISGLFVFLLAATLWCLGKAIFFLIRSFHNYEYSYISSELLSTDRWNNRIKELEEFKIEAIKFNQEIKQYYGNNGKNREELERELLTIQDPREKAQLELKEDLLERYAEATIKNALNNKTKSGYLHKTNQWIIYALIGVFFLLIPYIFNHFSKPHKVAELPFGIMLY